MHIPHIPRCYRNFSLISLRGQECREAPGIPSVDTNLAGMGWLVMGVPQNGGFNKGKYHLEIDDN